MEEIRGEPLFKVWYGDVFAGYIFYEYSEYAQNRYKFWPDRANIRNWMKEHPEFSDDSLSNVDIQNKSGEDYDLVFEIMKAQT